jgi:hypothetical protein
MKFPGVKASLRTMDGPFSKLSDLADHVKEYAQAKIASVKLETAARISRLLSNLFAGLIVAAVFSLFIIFGSVAGALAISAWTGKMYAGFLIVAGVYLLVGFIVWNSREKILRLPIMNSILRQLFKDDDYEKN